jgi:hypothetical protein
MNVIRISRKFKYLLSYLLFRTFSSNMLEDITFITNCIYELGF